MRERALTAVSLYSGAGGMDLGFVRAGFKVLWANDVDDLACRTYAENIGEHITCGDLESVSLPTDAAPDTVIGGPPCQGFSVIGRMDPGDPRSRHLSRFLDVVEQLRPRAFVLENVKALAVSRRWALTRDELIRRSRELGYRTRLSVLNAADFDVPQARERMFLIGIRETDPPEVLPTTADRPPTVRDALKSLPPFGQPGNDTTCRAKVIPASTPVLRPNAYRGSLLFNGSGRPLDLDAPAKTLPAAMGGNATPIVDQEELAHGASPWVVEYHAHLLAGGMPVEQAPTRMRRITVEEAAVLQSFPPGYRFHGTRIAQYRQIGNAVPPNLAQYVAAALRDVLSMTESQRPRPQTALAV
jgi:DNA (cytosine-5)-methyltransferase 1